MFTGIIAAVGHIKAIEPKNGDWRLTLATGSLALSDVQLGDSIATNGVCLTAIELGADFFVADVSAETLGVTTLGSMKVGSRVNLEKALRLADRLGGHLVSGHVDGVGEVLRVSQDARSWRFVISAPNTIAHYIAHKGSVCINGISLTVNHVDGHTFDVNIVPHTMDNTTIVDWQVGTQLNLEVDLLARYLERLLQGQQAPAPSKITADFLASSGY
ncbi:riboflavin synthase [Thiomicrospira cyclica]|uniref:Riboflavin synthase n=1 Tax=Thiomicrospira cyclica (strain DSM 14477 / JCM 11371 / ALM1) TaxID=717773 RepID=F6D8F5_THICA|nr:riboflavin synthase [Thiomicrospira cyclica]AEG31806.1 riboflavin synthase, alpha subunit [Thiomicrospira cyclica ALM1]